MKKITTLSTLAALALIAAGCARQPDTETAEGLAASRPGEPITFNMVAGEQTSASTRAKEFRYWSTGQTLKVTSYLTNTETKFNDFTLTYDGPYTTSWSYSPTVESTGQSISYYSYYPASVAVVNSSFSGHTGTMTYIATGQEDLMAANAWGPSPRVSLQFRHILSEINFAVQGVEGFHVTIDQIKINNSIGQGTYTFNAETGGSWRTSTLQIAYPYTPNSSTVFPTDGKSSDIIYLGNKGGTNTADNDNSNALMLIPQSFPGVSTGPNITLHYKLVDMNDVLYKEGDATAYLCDFTTKSWEMGKRYLYLIDPSGLVENGPITFEILAMGWGDNTPQAEPIIVSEAKEADITKLLIEKAISQHNTNKANATTLTVFPISLRSGSLVPGPSDQMVTLKDFSDTNFVRGDQIRIFCGDNALPARFQLDPTIQGSTWDLQRGLNYVTITKL